MTSRGRPPFRADHVGSLLRPRSLLELRERAARGEVSPAALRAHEDECIRAVVSLQESIGLEGISDGEYRRESFHGDFMRRIEGVAFELATPGRASLAGGPFVAVVSKRMRRPAGGIEVENFRYLRSLTARTPKQTIPSPTMAHFRGGRETIDAGAYPDMSEFFADLARVYREEVEDLAEAGCRYLQLDDTNLAYLCDERIRARIEERGESLDRLPGDYARLINESIRGRPADMAVCIHLCRGNARSRWFAEGGYEAIAETLFNEIDVDGFFLEYDDERSGDFAPLRFVPKSKAVVLGLVTTKRGALEDADVLRRRVDEASRYLPLDQLCLSPQCGFASAAEGNLLTEDEEKRKLELIVELAARIWS
ncbi:MAG TPA: 5-methyltetrahydropteroyltriglutamate--homocysteine S-methyltransferase [Gammaproteobacteria bacterium]|nr:5-methyltetrahydropteroyltriglutamate--homocysteine S-methyltransferase [Gammaproteobacteria bacterium]